MNILLFGGTIEGRTLALWLRDQNIPFQISVATEYGGGLLDGDISAHVGRLSGAEMEDYLRRGRFTHVVDATHPYAHLVTASIAQACRNTGLPLLRLVRDGDVKGNWMTAVDAKDAASQLQSMEGNIMLTTGSKDLDAFALPDLRERCFPRVLPTRESLDRCLTLGFPAKQVICMQGPFSQELNLALIRQFHIRVLVTKATGAAGGFWDKVEAAREASCALLVIGRPVHEEGLSLEGVQEAILRWREEA